MLPNLRSALEGTTFPWSLSIVGEDQSRKLAELMHDLRRPYSDSGAGKRIASGYPYWGIDPTIEWVRACGDPYYPVMKAGIETFVHRWVKLQDALEDRPYHYVSLGPGTGHKDRTVIEALRRGNSSLCYIPVDMSAEMLRLGVHEPIRSLGLEPGRVIPVQLDFSLAENLSALRKVLSNLLGDEPIVFSLLGNTLANFDDDVGLLQMLVRYLLGSDDRMILEVATTQSLGPQLADRAAEEYRGSDLFTVFVTSALQSYTDLTIDLGSVAFRGSVEDERAIRVDVIYRNQTDEDLQITLPGYFGPPTPFRRNDTVLLYITRKYTPAGLRELVDAAEVVIAAEVPWSMGGRDRGDGGGFGVATLVLQPAEHRVGAP